MPSAFREIPGEEEEVIARTPAGNITEYNNPQEQLVRLKELIEHIKDEELPATREEFESSALLFHIFMDIEDFLLYKKHFIDNLDKTQKKHYWKAG